MYGIRYLGLHSYEDMDITMAPGHEITIPKKKKILVSVPFSNEEYDFSEIYGSQTYEPRYCRYPFNIKSNTKTGMNSKKSRIINWLMNSHGKQKLYDDAYPGYYFLAEIEGDASFSENWEDGILTVTFKAYPFMIAELPEGNDIWDEFNFELDVSQLVDFTVNGNLDVRLLNVGTPDVIPEITCSAPMEIEKDGVIYTVGTGSTKDEDFMFKSGENNLKITGNGTISFTFYKELI